MFAQFAVFLGQMETKLAAIVDRPVEAGLDVASLLHFKTPVSNIYLQECTEKIKSTAIQTIDC